MNNRQGRAKFNNFQILLESGCSPTIVMRRLFEKLKIKRYATMQWKTQTGNITTNHKVKVYFTLPALSATNVMAWIFHVDESAKGIYDMILGKDLLK